MVMQTTSFRGIGASPGIAIGTAVLLDTRRIRTPKVKLQPQDIESELMRFKTAIALSEVQLEELRQKLAPTPPPGETGDGNEHALILDAHRMMLHDPMFLVEVTRLIRDEAINAEWAVKRVGRRLRHQFDDLDDEYFRERRSDIDFMTDRVVRNLLGEVVDEEVQVPEGAVVVAHDVSPATAALLLSVGKVAAFVTDVGGRTSHMAIVARAKETPAVVGLGRVTEAVRTGDVVAVDGRQGLVWLHPTESQLKTLRETLRRQAELDVEELATAQVPACTTCGQEIILNGNIEFPEEVASLLAHGAQGVGLYRTEFLFLNRTTPPTEEDHYQSYKLVLESMGGRPVTIRTLDLGADKVPGRKVEREVNPAMGLRAIRYALAQRDLFRAQLKALLRASAHGNLRVMFPMVSGVSELREARSELEACRSELSRQGVPLGKRFPVGIMVETPSAAWLADRLAQEADFFSIGTNDLIQYSLAIDRHNKDVAYLYRPLHLSVLRTLKFVVDAARVAGIPVSMCGEMAAEPLYTVVLLGLGMTELSMTAGQVPAVKRVVRGVSIADAVAVVEGAMKLTTAEEIERHVRAELARLLPAGTFG